MPSVYWFNPENDLALATDLANYTPARAGLELRRAGALLPTLWADEDDEILVVDKCDSTDTRVTHRAAASLKPTPWGWSSYAARIMERHGVADVPSCRELEIMRSLSHRETAARVLEKIGYAPELIPVTAYDTYEAYRAIGKFGNDAVVKLPWSCSGRGVFYTEGLDERIVSQRIEAMLRRQGGVTIEPRYDRKSDFAALFYLENGECRFRGVSVFAADAAGRYAGNLIAPQAQLSARLNVEIDDAVERIRCALPELLGDYEGWVGVDMLSYTDAAGALNLAPCIEVNLRMTMGVAALLASESGRIPWAESVLRVAMSGEMLDEECLTLSALRPRPGKPLESPCMIVERSESAKKSVKKV